MTLERMYLETMEKVLWADGQDGRRLEFGQPAGAIYRAGNRYPRGQQPPNDTVSERTGDRDHRRRRDHFGLDDASTFVVDPTEQALVLRFGQPVRDLIGAPGLYFKWPFIDAVVYIDKRILALDDERQEVLVSDNQRLEVDAFSRDIASQTRCCTINPSTTPAAPTRSSEAC